MPKNPPDISGTRSRAYNTRLPEDKTTLGNKSKSRMGSITAARKKGGLIGMPINGAGINYDKGKWTDNTGRVFGTAAVEDGPITLVQRYTAQRKAAKGN